MKGMGKIWKLAGILALIAVMIFTFASCKSDDEDQADKDKTQTEESESPSDYDVEYDGESGSDSSGPGSSDSSAGTGSTAPATPPATDTTPQKTQPSTTTPKSRPAQFVMYVDESDGYANVRSGPGTNYSVVDRLNNGAAVTVTGPVDNWYQIASGSLTGYYLHKSTLSNSNKYQSGGVSGTVLYVSEPDGYANVRTGRGTNYEVVGTLNNGTAVSVKNLKNGWYQIAEGSYAGYYIHKSTLTS